MILDIVFIILFIIFFYKGYKKGILVAAGAVAAIVISTIAAMKLSHTLAELLFESSTTKSQWALIISYALVFFVFMWLTNMLSKYLTKLVKAVALGWVNRLGGGILYGFIICFIFSSFLWLSTKISLLSAQSQSSSKTYAYILPIAPFTIEFIGKVLPFVNTTISEIEQFFDETNKKLPEYVGND